MNYKRLDERAPRLIYKDKCLSFQELSDKDGAATIHHRNLHKLVIEMYRAKYILPPGRLLELFEEQHHTHDLTPFHARKGHMAHPS